jgi:hypothetical protein
VASLNKWVRALMKIVNQADVVFAHVCYNVGVGIWRLRIAGPSGLSRMDTVLIVVDDLFHPRP